MKFLPLVFLVLLPLSGCLGIPDDVVISGDAVTATVTVFDAATGETLLDTMTLAFVVGTGGSGLGLGFENGVQGARLNETTTFQQEATAFEGVIERNRVFGPIPLLGEIPRGQFEQAFGPASNGMPFRPPQSFYNYRVESFDDTTLTYRVLPEDGQEDELLHLGSILVTTIDTATDSMTQTLEPIVGATFTIQPPTPFNPNTALELEPGSYEVLGADGDMLQFAHNPSLFPALVGPSLRFQVEVTDIQRGEKADVVPVDGNFGVRDSPQVMGPSGSSPPASHDHGSDGHDHTH